MSINYSTSTRIARFGRGAVILRGRNEALDESALRSAAPTLFAEGKHSSRSDRYSHIPTFEVLKGLAREGFRPYEVRVGGSGDEDKRNHTKHLIRLRRDGMMPLVGGSHREVVLLNSHDGTSAYKLMYGLFRLVCSNGLVISDGTMSELRVPHKGDVVSQVIEGTYTVVSEGERVTERVGEMQAITLSRPEQLAYAESAAMLRWAPEAETGTSTVPVRAEQVIMPRRRDDNTDRLWDVFNRAQENLVNGGNTYVGVRAGRSIHRTTRAVNGIDGNVNLNRALWALTARMAELKTGA